jgi:nitroimidazol reductase NimA-like FMN-containing flavoprotein (pyridoxamine 5'-phosphate oxidase superfamily)
MVQNGSNHGGTDIGRRIIEERARAGLTREQAAELAGMAPEYLAYLETSPSPNPSQGALVRLAAALGAPPGALSGAGMEEPPGQGEAARHPSLHMLTPDEARGYLGSRGVGRFLFDGDDGPVALPVNYGVLGDAVIFRTESEGSATTAVRRQQKVSFDVDHLDEALSEGWSVLVTGQASVITDVAELASARALGIEPWAGGDRETYIKLTVGTITGRRIRATE